MDFLLFNQFIAIPVLMAVYYTGVFAIPLVILWSKKYREHLSEIVKIRFNLGTGNFRLLLLLLFILFQIGWRMMFELMIGYFQMRDYLYHLGN